MVKNNFLKFRLKLEYKHSKDFAAFLNINKDQYCRYENNSVQPGMDTIYKAFRKIQKNLPDTHLEDLIYDDEE